MRATTTNWLGRMRTLGGQPWPLCSFISNSMCGENTLTYFGWFILWFGFVELRLLGRLSFFIGLLSFGPSNWLVSVHIWYGAVHLG